MGTAPDFIKKRRAAFSLGKSGAPFFQFGIRSAEFGIVEGTPPLMRMSVDVAESGDDFGVWFVITEIGHVFSSRSIVKFIKNERRTTTVETVLAYLRACEDAFLIRRINREDLIGKRILTVDEKYYVADLGLRRALVGDLHGEDIDQMLENVVCREFSRCGWNVTVGRVREKEVDFVCQKAGCRRYVQVAYLMPTAETREREFSALESVPDQYEKIVLSLDRVDFSRNGVRHVYLPTYLVELSHSSSSLAASSERARK